MADEEKKETAKKTAPKKAAAPSAPHCRTGIFLLLSDNLDEWIFLW